MQDAENSKEYWVLVRIISLHKRPSRQRHKNYTDSEDGNGKNEVLNLQFPV